MAEGASAALAQLSEDYWEGTLRRNPIIATYYGDYRYNDRLPDPGPAGRAAEQTALRETLERLRLIPTTDLAAEDLITHDMLRQSAEDGLASLEQRFYEWDVDQMSGPQIWLTELLNWHPLDTDEHQDQLIARYRAFPTYLALYQDNLRAGIANGRVAFRGATERVVDQLRRLLDTPAEDSPLGQPASRIASPRREELLDALRDAVYPAYGEMLEFLGEE